MKTITCSMITACMHVSKLSGGFILTFTAGLGVGIACSCFLHLCLKKKKSNLEYIIYICVLYNVC